MKKVTAVFMVLFMLAITIPMILPSNAIVTTQKIFPKQKVSSININTENTANTGSSSNNQPTLATSTMSGAWQELGPKPIANPNNVFTWGSAPYSGRVTAIAINGSNPQEIYLGAAQGGVWKSTDGGSSWTPLMDSQDSLAVGSIALSPDNKTIYVGTGEGNQNLDGYVGIGLLKSTDEGKTWTTLGANYFNNSAISSIAISKTNANHILVATTEATYAKGLRLTENLNGVGVFLSTDGGSSWARTLSANTTGTTGVAQLLINTSNDNIVYASDYNGIVWVSINGGSSWNQYLYTTGTQQGRVAIAMTSANRALLYAIFINSSGEIGFMVSYNNVTGYIDYFNYVPLPTGNEYGPCEGQCWYNLFIAVDPTNNNTIYVGTNNLYKSTDGGSSWTLLGGAVGNGYLHPDMHAFAFAPDNSNTIYVGNDGGVWKSTDGGSTWTTMNTNLGITQFNSFAASPTTDTLVMGGTQDNACDKYTNNTTWTTMAGGDGGASAFYNDTMFACNYVNVDVRTTSNGGLTFSNANTGLNTGDPTQFIAPMVQDPSNPMVMYLGTDRIYKTTTFAGSWTDVSGVISTGTITTIAVAKTNGNIIYEGDDQGIVKVSTNGGTSWTTIFDTNSLYSHIIPISSVAVDPFNSSLAMVALANQTNPRLFYTPNQGTNWYYFFLTGVPDVAINTIAINPITDVAFIGTDRGLYYLNDTGSWVQLGSGLPNSAIYSIVFTHSNYLIVGTHGRGAWLNYMTPFITLSTPTNNTHYKSGTSVSLSITDPNGIYHAYYHWDNAGSNTTVSSPYTISTTVPVGDGQHVLYVYAQDPADNWIVKKYIFITDDSPPVITLNEPLNNSDITTGTVINLTITDISTISTLYYNWNGTTNTTTTSIGGNIHINTPTGNGQAMLNIYAQDSAGNWASKVYLFTIHTPPPTTTSTPPSSAKSPGFTLLSVAMSLLVLSVYFIRRNYRTHK